MGETRAALRTEFFEKEMVGSRTLMERSALGKKVKMASISQMIIRRCANQVVGWGGGVTLYKTFK